MYEAFLARINNFDGSNVFEIQTHEVEFFLNEGQSIVVDDFYKEYEKSEKARRALSKLVLPRTLTGFTAEPIYTNGYKISTSTVPNVLYMVAEEVSILHNGTTKRVPVKPMTMDSYSINLKNPFKKPYEEKVWRLDIGDTINQVIIISPNPPQNYYLTYLQIPTIIEISTTSTSLLHEEFHIDIVDKAVMQALQAKQININLTQNTKNG